MNVERTIRAASARERRRIVCAYRMVVGASISETIIGAREASTPKTDTGRRSIALHPETVAALKAHRRRQAEEKIALGPAYQDSDLVFCREDGTSAWPRTFSRGFEKHVTAAGVPSLPLKNLRPTHATLALAAGVHPKVVQERLDTSSFGEPRRLSGLPAIATKRFSPPQSP